MMIQNLKIKTFLSAGLISAVLAISTNAQAVVESDARIKTIVYNDNEVFRVVARNGFQTDVELAADEVIDTLSIGDSIGWQITPASHRIFIKPLQKTGITNLSVITNHHTYQFELVASNPVSAKPDHAYVVKFYYPDAADNAVAPPIDRSRGSIRPINPSPIPDIPAEPVAGMPPVTPPTMPGDMPATPVAPTPPAPPPSLAAPMAPPLMPGDMKAAPVAQMPANSDGYNFNYTLTGPDALAPSKIYDDGRSTFFQFNTPPSPATNYAIVNPDGTEMPVPARADADGKIIVDRVAGKFTIREGAALVCVFNEQAPANLLPPPTGVMPPSDSPTVVVSPAARP